MVSNVQNFLFFEHFMLSTKMCDS